MSAVGESPSAPRPAQRPSSWAGRPDRWHLLVALASGPALLALSLGTDPDPRGFGTHEQLGLPACAMRSWFDVPCPACGVTTSVVRTTHGELLEAFRTQPFGPVVTLLVLALFTLGLRSLLTGRDLRPSIFLLPRWLRWGIGTMFLFGWMWKMVG